MQISSPRAERALLRPALASVALGATGLLIADVVGPLDLPRRVLSDRHLIDAPADYVALFAANAALALVAGALATFVGLVRPARFEAIFPVAFAALLAGGVAAYSAHAVVGRDGVDVAFLAAFAAAATIAVLAPLAHARRLDLRRWRGVVIAAGFLPIAVALTFRLAEADASWWPVFGGGLGALALAALALRVRIRGVAAAATLVPLAATVAIVAWSCAHRPSFRGGPELPTRAAPGRPNLVLIVLDTVRADRLKSYGHHRDPMPRLEAWARGAIRVDRAVSPAGWTSPAHASIFSGRRVSEHGVHYYSHFDVPLPRFRTRAVDGITWLPRRLADAGYACVAVSANSLALLPEIDGFHRKLSLNAALVPRTTLGGMASPHLPGLPRIGEWLRWTTPYATAPVVTAIVRESLPATPAPTFLFVNYMDAHSPYHPPRDAMRALGVDPPRLFPRDATHRAITSAWRHLPPERRACLEDLYDAELRGLDEELGDLLAWIDERLGPDTVVIVTSDHGEELGEHGRVGHEYGLAQSVIHVPLFVRARHLGAGVVEGPVDIRRLHDFLVAAAAGESPPLESIVDRHEAIISERYPSLANTDHFGQDYARPWVALIRGAEKIVGPSTFGLERFRIDGADFGEEQPTAGPEECDLSRFLDRYWSVHRDPRRPEDDASVEERAILQGLGYVD